MNGLAADVEVTVGTFSLRAAVHVEPGETVAVVGPNGAGKSTLVRALAGLVAVDGRVDLDGTPVEPGRVGLVPQDLVLFPHLSALDNVAFGLRTRGLSKARSRAEAREWLARFGVEDVGRLRPGRLSGGQAQRVALARALAPGPGLLLFDEPLSALDATARMTTRRELRRHLDGFGGPRLVVTHDPVDAMALADRIVVLEGGRVVQEGTPAEIAARPRSPYVADLVGVNLLRGTATRGTVALDGGGALTVAGVDDGRVLAVVHPRAVALHRAPPDGTPRNVWRGVVEAVDPEGQRARVSVVGPPALVAEVTADAVAALDLVPGQPVWVAVKATEIDAYAS